MQTINRKYKDSVFRTLFSDEDKLIELYNALFDTNYGPEANIEIVTLEDVVFRVLKNDVAFVIENSFIVLAEHQSTICNNMPLRDLIYMSAMLQRMINTDELYRKKLLKIPRPTFIVLYDGKEDFPEYQEMKLSDAFLGDDDGEISLQLTVRVYNINSDKNSEILKKCETLKQYSLFVERVRALQEKGEFTASRITELISGCIDCGILPEFLKTYGTEMVEMLFRELTREEDMEISRLDGYDDGLEEGLRRGEAAGLEKGRAEGETVGLEKGRATAILELARTMKANERPIAQIAADTGLTVEEIESL
ncbi:MAG: hypothetical protein ACI4LP_11705 [Anaerovoracaceae bacterium]